MLTILGVLVLLLAVGALLVRSGRVRPGRRRPAPRSSLAPRLLEPGPRPPEPPVRDAVTGLATRRGLLAPAPGAPSAPGAVVVVEVGLLAPVIATLGHGAAERAVALAAARVREVCSAPAVATAGPAGVARLSGDTFAVALATASALTAGAAADSLRAGVASPHVVDGVPFAPVVAVGLATASTPGAAPAGGGTAGPEQLLDRADLAHVAARGGGPAVRTWDPSLAERAERRVAILRDFASAVADGGLAVHFQPLVELRSDSVCGVEALVRWQHPELGMLLPDEFVPVLEAGGRVAALTTVVLEAALAAARGWLDRDLRLSVAVNVPVVQLDDTAFPDAVAEALARHDVPAELLTLELTESGVSEERGAALPVLRRLRGLGCGLSLDDFGTGQSSLAHLRSLPVDQLKIDKSFVRGMGADEQDAAIVAAVVEMGHVLGVTVVAEGVEGDAQRAALTAMDCDVAQGFGMSRALPAEELDRWLASRSSGGDEGGPRTLTI